MKLHTVLIADDYEADRCFLKGAIQQHAPRLRVVGEVADGEAVVAYLSGEGAFADREKYPIPDVLFLDVRMPRMTGIEVMEWLKTNHFPELKIVMLADSSSAIYRPKALSLGIRHFFSKAVDTDEIIRTVKQIQAEFDKLTEPPAPIPREIPPLILGVLRYDANCMSNLVVWGNLEVSRFITLAAAQAAVSSHCYAENDLRSQGARIFAWDGKTWNQIFG